VSEPRPLAASETILISGASENNLCSVTVRVPRRAITVITGPSGSGKSSLAFDTIFAEGQRQYLDSLSPFQRRGFDQLPRPRVTAVTGLGPAIAVRQQVPGRNPRSTVGSITEIGNLVRLLYSRAGVHTCLRCGAQITQGSQDAGLACGACGRVATATSSQFFSPNAPEGMCPSCEGLGVRLGVSDDRLVADEDASIRAGALSFYGDRRLEPKKTYWPVRDLPELLGAFGFGLDTPWRSLPQALREVILHGDTALRVPRRAAAFIAARAGAGLAPEIERLFRGAATFERKEFYQRYLASVPCRDCDGQRLAAGARAVRLAGDGIVRTMTRPVSELPGWLDRVAGLDLPSIVAAAVAGIGAELRRKVADVEQVGLGYLAPDRPVPTLSAGEGQRLRIARQLGSSLIDLVYVLDEPSAGLHPADTGRLIASLRMLRDAGNTVIVVEHDADLIRAADHIIDFGPAAGALGGRVVAAGTPQVVAGDSDSATARYLRGELAIGHRGSRRAADPASELVITGARLHNLRDVTARFPHGLLTCVTGPSGSGKSSLVTELLQRAVHAAIRTGRQASGEFFASLRGHEPFSQVVTAAQDPMWRNPRSIPATYVGIFDEIRRLFAAQEAAVRSGWTSASFSFNAEAGQCPACRGAGEQTMELHFLPDVRVPCPRCHGRRFKDEVLAVRVRGASIADVLDLDVATASRFFAGQRGIASVLAVLCDVGLGYLRLGQSAMTLSGGEAQRLKLARELCREDWDRPSLYILDEPTCGLHAVDVAVLVSLLHRLADAGHTVIVIEHNVDVIAAADWVIDLGPGSGPDGGTVVAAGRPEYIAGRERSALAPFLRLALGGTPPALSPDRLPGQAGQPGPRRASPSPAL
jgi:excinuclease ABC subunit A